MCHCHNYDQKPPRRRLRDMAGWRGFKNPFWGGAGDASLSPSHVDRHALGAPLGAVFDPTIAPLADLGSKIDPNRWQNLVLCKFS